MAKNTGPGLTTDGLFYESEADALKVTVMALGGNKKVGDRLWPGNTSSEQRVRDSLNPNREEKFSPGELAKLARWGRDIGCHAIAVWFNADAGYAPPVPISPADEKAELERQTIEAVKSLHGLLERLDARGFKLP